MSLLVDLFGFLSVILRGCALALAAVAIGGVIFEHAVLRGALARPDTQGIRARLTRLQAAAALALLAVTAAGKGLDLAILTGTVGVPWPSALTAPFALAGIVTCAGAAGLLVPGAIGHGRSAGWDAGMALLILAGLVVTTHATGRVEARGGLVMVSALHQWAGAAWIGGLPSFLVVLAAESAVARA